MNVASMTPAATDSKRTPFLSLPLEVRNQIYGHVLVRDKRKIIYPVLSADERRETYYPNNKITKEITNEVTFGLLYVNRQVHLEAKAVFYSENTFYFSAWAITKHRASSSYELKEPFASNLHLFKRIQLRFSFRDLRRPHTIPFTNPVGQWEEGTSLPILPERLKQRNILFVIWAQMINALWHMPLRYLRFDTGSCESGPNFERLLVPLLSDPALLGSVIPIQLNLDPLYSRDDWTTNSDILQQLVTQRVNTKLVPSNIKFVWDGSHDTEEQRLVHEMGIGCSLCRVLPHIPKNLWHAYKYIVRRPSYVTEESVCSAMADIETMSNGYITRHHRLVNEIFKRMDNFEEG